MFTQKPEITERSVIQYILIPSAFRMLGFAISLLYEGSIKNQHAPYKREGSWRFTALPNLRKLAFLLANERH